MENYNVSGIRNSVIGKWYNRGMRAQVGTGVKTDRHGCGPMALGRQRD